ncbi:MAG: J domain-containing protein [Spirochaetales bacterium]|nr:J domain-containing protein [Spirochaetales bacterium]
MKNYYDLFGLKHTCSLEEVKSSFRGKVKRLHPDLSRDTAGVERFRLLLEAYRVLIDPEARADYDRRMRFSDSADGFVYRDFLKERADGISLAKLIFFDLLHDNEDEALDLYETLLLQDEFSLEIFMDREDFMDCAFLLAEEYEKQRRYAKSFDLLVKIVRFERQKPYFRHFLEEVIARMRSLAASKLSRELPPQECLARYFQVVEFNLSHKETNFYTKKIAEVYLGLGRADLAGDYLDRKSGKRISGGMKQKLGCS